MWLKKLLLSFCLIAAMPVSVWAEVPGNGYYEEYSGGYYEEYSDGFFVCADGVYSARLEFMPGDDGEYATFIVFYVSGEMHGKHPVSPIRRHESFLNQELNRLYLTSGFDIATRTHIEYTFDITTGELIREMEIYTPTYRDRINFSVTPAQGFTIGVLLIGACILVVVFLYFIES